MKKYYNLKKSVIWDCRFFHQSETCRTFSQSLTLFFHIFSTSSWKSDRHVCQRSPGIQRHMDSWNWWKSWSTNKTKQPSRQIRCLYTKIWKSCGIFKARSNCQICKNNILFPERWSLFDGKNNNIWAQMQPWWCWRFCRFFAN